MTNATTIPKREFFLNSNVTAESVKDIILGINEANKYDDENSRSRIAYIRQPIKLIIDSFGGEIYSGMALVNTIDTSTTPVHTYCYGKAMSMGLVLFIVGHKRFTHPLATFMQHQLSGGSSGKFMDMVESLEEKERLNTMLEDLIISMTDIEKADIEKYRSSKTDWFFTGKEAIRLGVADELIVRKTVA